MSLNQGLTDLVAVALVAALAPLLVAVLPGPRIPQVVIFLVGGVLIGPHVLGLAETSAIQLLANIGLGFLFLLAGYELDPSLLRQRPGQLAMAGWLISAVIAVGVAAGLTAAGYIRDYVPVGLALTTTALGTLLPILRDNDMLSGRFGRDVYAAGAVGELFPILIIAVFLTRRGHFIALASVALVGVLALALTAVPWLTGHRVVQRILQEGQDETAQITLRGAMVLLFVLLAVASRFGLDVVLGAMLAGMVLRGWARRSRMDIAGLERKFDAVGYGIFIPIFFISSGMTLDLKAIARDPLRLLIFFALLLIVRGLPSLLVYRRALPARQRVEMTFITATTLPLLIALVDIGQQDGVMLPATAAGLVGAGVLSVLVYPLIAVTLHRSAPLTRSDVGASAVPDNPEPRDEGDQSPQPPGLPGRYQFVREDGDLPEVAPDLPHPGAYRSAARAPRQRVAAVGAASYSADMVVRTGKVINARWLARAAFALVLAAAADLVGFADLASLAMVAVGAAGACLTLAGGYWFLAHRGVLRWVAFAVVVLAPVTVLVIFALHGLLWVALVAVALIVLAAGAGRRALTAGAGEAGMPSRDVPPPRHAFLIMNPRSGGGKVARFGLKDKAEALGAEVALLDGPGTVDVAALARQAVAGGADLLGVAGGDGTQALVAGIAAEHALPFLVISAGTRNHFALDLGLDRENPAACLDALSDGVEQRIDLGVIGDRTFVNNASFGAYAEVVRSPAYRDDKRGTTLQVLPELLSGHRGATLTVRAGGVTVTGPQAVLVSNNAYEMGDIAGLGHRARLDAGTLGIVVITVNSAMGAVGLLGGGGVMALAADEVVVDADEPEIPVGIDGETVMMPTPVRCAVRPQALRVRVPRDRPGVRPLKPRIDWSALRKLASLRSAPAGTEHQETLA